MEKIKSKKLISLIRKNRCLYNEIYADFLFKYPGIDKEIVFGFINYAVVSAVEVFEDHGDMVYENIFGLLYGISLELAGSNLLHTNLDEYIEAFKSIKDLEKIVSANPGSIIKNYFAAVKNVLLYKPDEFGRWINFIKKTGPLIESEEIFFITGRMAAWLCGMTFLRSKIISDEKLPYKITDILLKDTGISFEQLYKSFENSNPWIKESSSQNYNFKYRIGGFRGYEGFFLSPPYIVKVDNDFLATDGDRVFAVMADSFGSFLYEAKGVDPKDLEAYKKKNLSSKINNIEFSDIRSTAFDESTLILSRDSSHYIYVYARGKL